MSSRQLAPGDIDDANLAYHYEAEETANGKYYHLIDGGSMTTGFPKGFYASERLDDVARQNRVQDFVLSSGDEARRSRGKKVPDDKTLPSQNLANDPNIEQVLSSGKEAQKQRENKDKDIGNERGKGKGK